MADVVAESTKHLVDLVKSVITEDVVESYDIVDLAAQGRDLSFPFVGVVYAGMKRQSQSSTREGRDQMMLFYVYIVAGGKEITINSGTNGDGHRAKVTQVLSALRETIIDKQAPNYKKWIFEGESPQDLGNGVIAFVQMWQLPYNI